ncbi:MAG: metal ABC transporter substrate-binding protein [Clostridium sp.]|uniref:metal ABC transporter substrate-binding protein n=1 Tax=Clostridium sp. TaxID=1506 RepID=UPI002910462E|nr:metal ABC transporter substrate-binding protein [Clostridium sp.]MDU5108993.1 metal ABC transporter substrate-binding protein [Clostridium sp.]
MKKLTYILVIFTSILFLGLTFSYNPLMANTTDELDEKKEIYLNILTVNKDIYDMTKLIVGEKHNVEYLFKNEKEMATFKVTDAVLNNINNKDLLLYNGLGYENWINDISNNVKGSNLGVINLSRGIRPLSYELEKIGQENPYYLLGSSEYKIALYNIKMAMQERDIENRSYYEENYNNVVERIDEFLTKSKEEIKGYKGYTIITNTDKFDYLFRDLGITITKVRDSNDLVDLNDSSNVIFFYDETLENINDLKDKMKNEYKYVGLSLENSDNVVKANVNKIIEAIKK